MAERKYKRDPVGKFAHRNSLLQGYTKVDDALELLKGGKTGPTHDDRERRPDGRLNTGPNPEVAAALAKSRQGQFQGHETVNADSQLSPNLPADPEERALSVYRYLKGADLSDPEVAQELSNLTPSQLMTLLTRVIAEQGRGSALANRVRAMLGQPEVAGGTGGLQDASNFAHQVGQSSFTPSGASEARRIMRQHGPGAFGL
jgi:hypothetical protein